ncbi:hypothetical protein KF728_24320 [Candidatus Obscuribacterales bacterium]|nr:hypothetical protein [Candidatus Obscuribacterales bacterium]MBX3153306.1 hypothetical protein [Candidatus Obscuribacterales bacterium]
MDTIYRQSTFAVNATRCGSLKRTTRRNIVLLLSTVASLLGCAGADAQSLKPEAPTPLRPGINRGLVDALVGPQYWTFMAQPGENKVHVTFSAMGIYGSAPRTSVTFTMSDPGNTWHTSKVITSQGTPIDATFDGTLKKPTKVIVTVAPPTNALLRVGGNYEIEVTGAVSFLPSSAPTTPIVGVYKQLAGYTKPLGDCKFTSDGKVVTTSGASGDWKIFDEETQTYIVNIDGEQRHSLKFVPGRGLIDNDIIIYQQLR